MSVRVDTSSWISGAVLCGDRGLGITGAVIRATTATGTHGPGILYPCWDNSGDDPKEFRALLTGTASSGTLFVYEDGSFSLVGAADGAYTIPFDLYVDGAPIGSTSFTVLIGTVNGSATASIASITLIPPTGSASGTSSSLPTIGRPSADLSAGGWVPSTGTDLYPMVDEVTPADGDYISTSTASTCEMELNETAYPGTATQVFRVRASSTSGSSLVITLKQGSTVIATRTQVLTTDLTTYSYSLTSGEIALIGAGALSISLQAV